MRTATPRYFPRAPHSVATRLQPQRDQQSRLDGGLSSSSFHRLDTLFELTQIQSPEKIPQGSRRVIFSNQLIQSECPELALIAVNWFHAGLRRHRGCRRLLRRYFRFPISRISEIEPALDHATKASVWLTPLLFMLPLANSFTASPGLQTRAQPALALPRLSVGHRRPTPRWARVF